MNIKLLDAATATSSAPTASTDGLAVKPDKSNSTQKLGAFDGDEVMLFVRSTAGSGTMTVKLRMWVWHEVVAMWVPYGTSPLSTYADADRGVINQGQVIGETATDRLQHSEKITGLRHVDRVYLQVVSIGGTDTAVSAWILSRD